MRGHRRLRLVVGSGLVAVVAAATSAASTPAAATSPVTIESRFVVFERPYVGIDNLGPIDLAELFHPGGIGGEGNLPCTPDRLDIIRNEVTLSVEPGSLEVTGTASLLLSCQFHFGEGCTPEERSLDVEFMTGVFDPATLQMLGNASISAPERVAQSWGNARVGDPSSCTWGTYSLGGIGPYEQPWRLDLTTDPATGFFASDILTGDPAQRVGHFEVSNPESVVQILALAPTPDAPASSAAPGAGAAAADPADAGNTDAAADAPTRTTLAGLTGVFAPSPDDSPTAKNLWIAFFCIFVVLAAVFVYGKPFLRRFQKMRER